MRNCVLLGSFLFALQTAYGQSNVFPESGNVGIGTAAPTYKLTLDVGNSCNGINIKSDGDMTVYSDIMFEMKTTAAAPVSKPTMWVLSSRKDGMFSGDNTGNTFEMYAIKKGGGYIAPLLFKSNGDLIFAGAKNADNGLVGIGVNNPRSLLDVGRQIGSGAIGTVLARLSEGDMQGEGTFLGVRAWESRLPGYGATYNGKSFSIEHAFYGQLNSAINFYRGESMIGGYITFATYNGTERMRISTSGSVGIGTTTPNEKLEVNGKIRAKEIKVEASNWPDYVFKSRYKLMPLNEVAHFIKQNGHLPGVSPAKNAERDGIDLGANQAVLLRKIEELTLYIIEQQKYIEQLHAEIKKNKK